MPSLDVLNTTQAELINPDIHGFTQRLPWFQEMEKRGNVSTERGTQKEWMIPYGASSSIISANTGDEVAPTTRAKRIEKYALAPSMLFGVITIPTVEMRMNEGKRGAYKLYEQYPKAFLEMYPIAFERYVVGGVSGNTDFVSTADLSGFCTLNGGFSSGTMTGTTNGLLDFAAPASQSDTVLNVAKSESKYHYNQFQESTGMSELEDKVRLGLREAARFSKAGKGPQVLMFDPDSFSKWQSARKDRVRVQTISQGVDSGDMFEDVCLNAKVRENHFINLADFTGAAAEGVGYGLDYDFLFLDWYKKPTMTPFKEGAIANQPVVVAQFEAMFMWGAKKLTSMVAFAGTARA